MYKEQTTTLHGDISDDVDEEDDSDGESVNSGDDDELSQDEGDRDLRAVAAKGVDAFHSRFADEVSTHILQF